MAGFAKPPVVFAAIRVSSLAATVQTNGWMVLPACREIEKCEASVKKYPAIKLGEDGYGNR
jgi:hypothetical protein